jgi:hypothetical protein
MVNMRAGAPRLGTVCDEYRLGDLKLSALKTMRPLVALRDREDHQSSLVRAARIAVDDVTCRSPGDLIAL